MRDPLRDRAERAQTVEAAVADNHQVVHVLVPGEWSVQEGHRLLERWERDVREAVPGASVFAHLEPADDPSSLDDAEFDRVPAVMQRPAARRDP